MGFSTSVKLSKATDGGLLDAFDIPDVHIGNTLNEWLVTIRESFQNLNFDMSILTEHQQWFLLR